jgi:hemerythrin superfamily protein
MDAIKLLEQQHRLVERLFELFDNSEDDDEKKAYFFEIADSLATHTIIEERYFYPAVRARQTEEEVEEAYDEHLGAKKLILEGLRGTEKPGFDGIVAALKGAIEHHVEEEEDELFPTVQKLLSTETLEALGQLMEAEALSLMAAGEPRKLVKVESEQPAPMM